MFAPRKRRPLRPSILSLEAIASASNFVPGLPPVDGLARGTSPLVEVGQSRPTSPEKSSATAHAASPAQPRRIAEGQRPLAFRPWIEPMATMTPLISASAFSTTTIEASPQPNKIAITPPIVALPQNGAAAPSKFYGGAGIIGPMTMTATQPTQHQQATASQVLVQQPVDASEGTSGGGNTSGGGTSGVGTSVGGISGGGGISSSGANTPTSNIGTSYNTSALLDDFGVQSVTTGPEHGNIKVSTYYYWVRTDEGGGFQAEGKSWSYQPNPGFFGQDYFSASIYVPASYGVFAGTQTRNFVVTVYPPPISNVLGHDDSPTANNPATNFNATLTSTRDGVVLDQATIQWTTKNPNGTFDSSQTTTTDGDASNTLHTSTRAGDGYTVTSTVVAMAVDGGPLTPVPASFSASDSVVVQPGSATNISFLPGGDTFPVGPGGSGDIPLARLLADGTSQTQVEIIARDAGGNRVADGTPVAWDLAGSGRIINSDSTTKNGVASATVQAGIYAETMSVSARVDGAEVSANIQDVPVNIQLGITGHALDLGSNETQTVTATVTDANGNPVADNTPITWYTQKGTIVGQGVVVGGTATATLKAIGGSQNAGNGLIKAFVGSNAGSATFLFVHSGLGVDADQQAIAGDTTTDGSVAIDQAVGDPISYDYVTGTTCRITNGQPNAVMDISIGGDPTLSGLLTLTGDDGIPKTSTTVTLDANGRGTFRVQSTGNLPTKQEVQDDGTTKTIVQGVIVPINVTTDPGWLLGWLGIQGQTTTVGIALEPARVIAGTKDFVSKLGWGALAGNGNSAEEIAGDLAFSMIPVVGVLSDVRDMGKELAKLWPGGEDVNWLTFGFSVAGVVGEFFGPGDLFFDVGKQLAKVVTKTSPVWFVLLGMAKNVDLSGLQKLYPTLAQWWKNPAFRELAEGVGGDATKALIKSDVDVRKLEAIGQGIGEDTASALLTRIGGDASMGADAARRAMEKLGNLNTDQLSAIQSAGKLDYVADSLGNYTVLQKELDVYTGWAQNLKKGIPDIPGSADEQAIDVVLRSGGAVVEPNILEGAIKVGEKEAGSQADRFVNGVLTEYKTVKNLTGTTADQLSGQLSSRITSAKKQSGVIIVDLRGQTGMTKEIAERAFNRAVGADDSKLLKSVRLIGDKFDEILTSP